jgi:hypothetical protein
VEKCNILSGDTHLKSMRRAGFIAPTLAEHKKVVLILDQYYCPWHKKKVFPKAYLSLELDLVVSETIKAHLKCQKA